MNFVKGNDPTALAKEACRVLENRTQAYSDYEVLILFSGGSALSLVDFISPVLFTHDVTISVVDERYTHEESASNFSGLLKKLGGKNYGDYKSIDTRVQKDESFDAFSSRINTAHMAWRKKYPIGKCIAVMGVGEDGHTAGIFPMEKDRFDTMYRSSSPIVPVVLGAGISPFPLRITSSISYITSFDTIIVYSTGDSKCEAIRRLVAIVGEVSETPARIFREMKDVTVFTTCNNDMIY